MSECIDRVCRFNADVYEAKRDIFERLAGGQQPPIMFISCADSRVAPEIIMQAEPGELFVSRNAGNIVPPVDSGIDGGVAGTVEFGVGKLKVQHIVVCGHFDCGAVKSLGKAEVAEALPTTAKWIALAEGALRAVDGRSDLSDDERTKTVALQNVKDQLKNLEAYPAVAKALQGGELKLHGWYVDFKNGEVLALDGATGEFVRIEDRLPEAFVSGPPSSSQGLAA